MSLEELQDYAIKLEETVATNKQELEKSQAENLELTSLNKALQKRNNDLFMKVEQQPINEPQTPKAEPEPVPTYEDVAKNLYKELRK